MKQDYILKYFGVSSKEMLDNLNLLELKNITDMMIILSIARYGDMFMLSCNSDVRLNKDVCNELGIAEELINTQDMEIKNSVLHSITTIKTKISNLKEKRLWQQ